MNCPYCDAPLKSTLTCCESCRADITQPAGLWTSFVVPAAIASLLGYLIGDDCASVRWALYAGCLGGTLIAAARILEHRWQLSRR